MRMSSWSGYARFGLFGAAPTLSRNMSGPIVADLQHRLKQVLPSWAASIDQDGEGQFGPRTQAAVVEFERQAGLKVDSGIVGPQVWGALYQRTGVPTAGVTPESDSSTPPGATPPKQQEAGSLAKLGGVLLAVGLLMAGMSGR